MYIIIPTTIDQFMNFWDDWYRLKAFSKSPTLANLMAFDDLMIAGIAMNPPNMLNIATVTIAFIIRVRASLASVSGLYMVFCFLFVYTIM